ncbi:MAG: MBOAT family protein [Planctomycetes bacterium]|nr:MBOAT family protein [Planctomycetota bacterium]
MLFHSAAFALLLATVLLLDRLLAHFLPGRAGWGMRCGVFLLASLVFYGAWDPGTPPPELPAGPVGAVLAVFWRLRYLGLMCGSIVFDWWVSRNLGNETREGRRKLWLASSVVLQLSILATFKYWNFLRDSLAAAGPLAGLGHAMPHSDLVLPVGISFYTFQSLSYTVDVYRRVIPPEPRLRTFALFVSFFPQLVAGPIVRAKDFLWQVQIPKHPKLPRILAGLERFAIGFFKKTVIADNLSPLADSVFNAPEKYCAANRAAALLMWGIVIYSDFSGYSDMAIGCARMMGFKFLENFHFPYLARTVTQFWKRWHISLSEWLRDYLYIPLGGSRHGLVHTMAALLTTMLLGGLWHGASWNFVLWGAWWGAWLAGAHLWRRAPERIRRIPVWITAPATFSIAMLGWIPFRCQGFDHTREMLSGIFSTDLLRSWSHLEFVRRGEFEVGRQAWAFALVALAASMLGHAWGLASGSEDLTRRDRSAPGARAPMVWYGSRWPVTRGIVIAVAIVGALLLRQTGHESFIYFQF